MGTLESPLESRDGDIDKAENDDDDEDAIDDDKEEWGPPAIMLCRTFILLQALCCFLALAR